MKTKEFKPEFEFASSPKYYIFTQLEKIYIPDIPLRLRAHLEYLIKSQEIGMLGWCSLSNG